MSIMPKLSAYVRLQKKPLLPESVTRADELGRAQPGHYYQ